VFQVFLGLPFTAITFMARSSFLPLFLAVLLYPGKAACAFMRQNPGFPPRAELHAPRKGCDGVFYLVSDAQIAVDAFPPGFPADALHVAGNASGISERFGAYDGKTPSAKP
jgi:hypothetical protein